MALQKLQDRAIHNNINYDNYDNDYINDLTTINDSTHLSDNHNPGCFANSLAETSSVSPASPNTGIVDAIASSSVVLPPDWRYLKIDLANNASNEELAKNKNRYKLSFSVLSTRNGGYQYFKALMNSDFRFLKRGLTAEEYDTEHYHIIQEIYKHRKSNSDFCRASKCYLKGQRYKGQSIQQLSTVLTRIDEQYIVDLVIGDHWMEFQLNGQLTQAQRKNNFIATYGQGTQRAPRLTAADLFGPLK